MVQSRLFRRRRHCVFCLSVAVHRAKGRLILLNLKFLLAQLSFAILCGSGRAVVQEKGLLGSSWRGLLFFVSWTDACWNFISEEIRFWIICLVYVMCCNTIFCLYCDTTYFENKGGMKVKNENLKQKRRRKMYCDRQALFAWVVAQVWPVAHVGFRGRRRVFFFPFWEGVVQRAQRCKRVSRGFQAFA